MLGTVSFGAGSAICGVGLLAGGLLCAAGRLASGNVQVQAWELLGDSRELQVLPTMAAPGMVWDAMQSMVGKAALAGGWVGGRGGACLWFLFRKSVLLCMHICPLSRSFCLPAACPTYPAATSADVSGENVITRLHFHPPSGGIAVATALRGREGEAAHLRVPLLHLVDCAGEGGSSGPPCIPMHTGGPRTCLCCLLGSAACGYN